MKPLLERIEAICNSVDMRPILRHYLSQTIEGYCEQEGMTEDKPPITDELIDGYEKSTEGVIVVAQLRINVLASLVDREQERRLEWEKQVEEMLGIDHFKHFHDRPGYDDPENHDPKLGIPKL